MQSFSGEPRGTRPPGLPTEVSDLYNLARFRAQATPDAIVCTFLVDGEIEERHLRYGDLDARAQLLAAKLQTLGSERTRVLLLFEPGLDYIVAFFGTLYAGMVPVPAYPADLMRAERTLPRLQALAADCQPAVVLGSAGGLGFGAGLIGRGDNPATVLVMPEEGEAPAEPFAEWAGLRWSPPTVAPEDIAFLQYTSGSTSTPRGVMVSHANLFHQMHQMQVGWQKVYPATGELGVVGVSWLPLYHDLGLIGGILTPFYAGKRMVLMSPLAFIQRPIRWLWAMARYRAVVTGAPNFAYDLCANKFRPEDAFYPVPGCDQPVRMDLSDWRIAVSGAEPIRPITLERFTATFAPYGLDPSCWMPSYGMAEATLVVSGFEGGNRCPMIDVRFTALEQNRVEIAEPGEQHVRRLVGCGKPVFGTEVRIVDPRTMREVAQGWPGHSAPGEHTTDVGEIWMRGPSVTLGYWNRREETEATFGARIVSDALGAGFPTPPFMRTGDLGFFHDGILYLTGRLKETMIFWGRNVYPQDIEQTVASCHESLKINGGAAFGIEEEGQEQLIVVQEVLRPGKLDLTRLAADVRQAIMAEHRVPLRALVLIRPGALPKTSSGKIQRHEARRKYLAGELEPVAQWMFDVTTVESVPTVKPAEGGRGSCRAGEAPDEPTIRAWLRERIAMACGVPADQISEDEPLSHYVLDSITLVAIARDVEAWLGRSIAPTILFDSPTLVCLAGRLTDPGYYTPGEPSSLPKVESLSEQELDQALAQLLGDTDGRTEYAGEGEAPAAPVSPGRSPADEHPPT